jgi:hypothetical protein
MKKPKATALPGAKPKILFIWTEWSSNEYRKKNNAYGGIGYYRIIKPAQYLKQWYDIDIKGRDIADLGETGEDVWKHVFETYDLVFTKHTDNAQAANAMLALADNYKKPIIVDMDDNYLTNRRRRTSWWLAKSFGPLTVLILNRRYSPERGLPSSKTTMLPTDSLPWKLLMS